MSDDVFPERDEPETLRAVTLPRNTQVWKPIHTAPRNGDWFIARTKNGTTRVVHFADKFDRLPISHDDVVWSTAPIEWTESEPVLATLDDQPNVSSDKLVEAAEYALQALIDAADEIAELRLTLSKTDNELPWINDAIDKLRLALAQSKK